MRELAQQLLEKSGGGFPAQALGRSVFLVCRGADDVPALLVASGCRKELPGGFAGEELRLDDGGIALVCPHDAGNAAALRRHFPWCAPRVPGGERPTAALGSWEGTALRLAAAGRAGLVPVFPSSFPGGLRAADAAAFAVFAAGFRDGFAVDGGRVSTASALEKALAGGAGIVTLTPRDEGSGAAEDYAGKCFVLDARDAVTIGREEARRCAALFAPLVEAAAAGKAKRPGFDLCVALDGGAPQAAAHLYVVRELHRRGIDCATVFPVYPDSPEEFRGALRLHVKIAKAFGGGKTALPLAGIPPELFGELRRECGEWLHLEPDAAAWEQFAAYFPA